MLGLAIFAIAFAFALRSAIRSVGDSYQRRMAAWAKRNPKATRVQHRGAAIGQMLATLWFGPRALVRGWREGWREGWGSGKQWAATHRPVPAEPAAPEPAEPEAAPAAATPTARPVPAPRRPDGRPDLRAVPDDKPTTSTTPDRTSTRKDSSMPIETATGGEVTSPETLVAELQAIKEEAAADLEDAGGDAARAEEDLGRIERMVASLSNLHLPEQDVALVAVMTDTAKARSAAAADRAAAADARLAQANEALEMAYRHLQMQNEAAGEFYGN